MRKWGFRPSEKKQENQSRSQKKQVNQVASISAALNEKLAALYRVHLTLPVYLFFFTFAYHGTEEPWFWDTVGSLSFNNYVIFASPPLFSQFLIMFDTLAYIQTFNMCMFWCKFNFSPIFFRVFLHNLGDYLGIRHVPCAISIPKRGKNIPSTPHTLGIQFRQPLAASRAAAPCPPPQLFWERKHEKSETMCQFYTIIAP